MNVEYIWLHSANLTGITSSRRDGGGSDHDVLVSTAGI